MSARQKSQKPQERRVVPSALSEFWQVAIGDLDSFYIFTPIERLGGGEPARPPGEAAQEALFLYQIIHGGNTRTWYSVSLAEDWDELNAPPRPLAGAQQILAVGGSLVELAEQTLLRRRHDLSPN